MAIDYERKLEMVRSFCIVCREMPIRMKLGLEHIRQSGVDVEPFYGIHAAAFGLVPTISYKQADGEVKPTTVGHLGCTLSHYVLMNALEHMPQEETLVFEDDATLPPDFVRRFEKVYAALPPGWEFVQLGHFGGDVVPVVGPFGKPLSSFPGGCHCYLVNRRGVKRILDLLNSVHRPWDALLAECCWPFMSHWCLVKSLAGQRSVTGEWFRSTLDQSRAASG